MDDLPTLVEIHQLLDELGTLIQQLEHDCVTGTPAEVLDRIRAQRLTTRRIMEDLGAAISEFSAMELPADVTGEARAFITARVRAWSRTSPLFHHVFNTPRKKLGPYEVYDLLLDSHSGGADVAGLMLDDYYMNMTTSVAFRLRHKSLTQQLGAEIRRQSAEGTGSRPVRLLNLHTGSGRELQELVRDRSLRAAMKVTCLDTDASALRRVKQVLGPQLGDRAEFRLGDPRKLAAARTWPDVQYDLIYALVLFDELSDRQIELLISSCHRGLRPGGMLVFGNFADSMPTEEHTIIRWILNLNIRRRSEGTLRAIFGRTPFGAQAVSCKPDSFGASFLVMARRT